MTLLLTEIIHLFHFKYLWIIKYNISVTFFVFKRKGAQFNIGNISIKLVYFLNLECILYELRSNILFTKFVCFFTVVLLWSKLEAGMSSLFPLSGWTIFVASDSRCVFSIVFARLPEANLSFGYKFRERLTGEVRLI